MPNLSKLLARGDRILGAMENRKVLEIAALYKTALDNIRKETAQLYERHAREGVLDMADVQQYNRLANTEKRIAENMRNAANRQVAKTRTALNNMYAESYHHTGYSTEAALGADIGIRELPDRVLEKAWENPLDRIGWPDRAREQARIATRQVREELATGIQQNKTYPQVARSIRDRMNMAMGRAERIVRTESHRVKEQARWELMKEAEERGVEYVKIWMATLDERTRDGHANMDGKEVSVERDGEMQFRLPDGSVGYPGNTGVPGQDVNCRCTLSAEIRDFRPQTRRAALTDKEYQTRKKAAAPGEYVPRTERIANMNYREWQEMKGIKS